MSSSLSLKTCIFPSKQKRPTVIDDEPLVSWSAPQDWATKKGPLPEGNEPLKQKTRPKTGSQISFGSGRNSPRAIKA
ncbi:hypothetical protein Y981_02160 [Leptospirillum ferriphilum YSK]|uniref:Uncharacterized protein n=1 Tax=Leptospirillum ferriphilum YSK TaxID=1441628 RepID=A0A059XS89_9BACT|nr:hypothetical protein Y981_02160 [Leptospirillum ferriphilum YSK]